VTSLLLAVASGVMTALALPQAIPWVALHEIDPAGHLEWLAWVGLVPALFALDRARGWKSALGIGLVAGLSYFYGAIWWVSHAMTSFGGVPLPLALVGLTLLVLYMAAHWAAALLASWTVRRRLGWPLWAHLPAIWVGAELSRNYLFTGFPWANLGYLQARHLVVAQLASLTGVYGIAALVVLVNCVVHAAIRAALERRPQPWRLVVAAAALVVLVVAYGSAHLRTVAARAAAAPTLTIALVQGNVNQSVKNQGPRQAQQILGRYVPLTLEADRRGADLVAWPEAAYPYLVPADLDGFAGRRTGLPRLEHAHLLLGAASYVERRLSGGGRQEVGSNSVFLLRPDLTVLGRYAKHHLVPFGEYVPLQGLLGHLLRSVVPVMVRQQPGSALRVLAFDVEAEHGGGTVRLAPMICFDAIFPEVNVAFAAQDPDLLLNPTNDAWYGYSSGPYQFLSIVSMRAIEAGKAVARPAYAGVTAIIDPTGEVRPGALPIGPVDPDLAPDPDEPPRMLIGSVPRLRGRTPYTTFGDLFAGAASLYGATALVLALRRRHGQRPRQGATT
jgi:apolipoprotein N-acyltransferase